jgi:hypothetical protein
MLLLCPNIILGLFMLKKGPPHVILGHWFIAISTRLEKLLLNHTHMVHCPSWAELQPGMPGQLPGLDLVQQRVNID